MSAYPNKLIVLLCSMVMACAYADGQMTYNDILEKGLREATQSAQQESTAIHASHPSTSVDTIVTAQSVPIIAADEILPVAIVPLSTHQENNFTVANNATITIQLSADDPNRLYVQRDKITHIACPQGFCLIDRQHMMDTGDVLMSLGEVARLSSAFTFFVTTQSGKHFAVVARPQKTVGQTIGFKVEGTSSLISHHEKIAPFPQLVVSLIKSMMRFHQAGDSNALPTGYSGVSVPSDNQAERQTVSSGFSVLPHTIIQGSLFTGIIYRIKNHDKETLKLHHKTFYQKTMIGVAFSKESLQQGEIGFIYALLQNPESSEGDHHV